MDNRIIACPPHKYSAARNPACNLFFATRGRPDTVAFPTTRIILVSVIRLAADAVFFFFSIETALRGRTGGNLMSELHEIKPEEIQGNIFDLIGNRWALLSAGTKNDFNTMTVSWGAAGIIWGTPAVFVFVRPQRYTLEFLKKSTGFTLSFYSEAERKALTLLGSKSGRDGDKVAESGLTPVFADGTVYFGEAKLVLFCHKLYEDGITPAGFKDTEKISPLYAQKDYHQILIGGITKVLSDGHSPF